MISILRYSFIKYLLVGVINTIVGLGIIFTLMYCRFTPEIANIIGYSVGIIVSYILNKYFTFHSNNSHKKDFFRFVIAMGIAYVINLIVLSVSYRYFGINKYISQIIAGICYTISGYVLNKFYTFRH